MSRSSAISIGAGRLDHVSDEPRAEWAAIRAELQTSTRDRS